MTRDPVQPAAIRRKVESWLGEDDHQMAIALRAQPVWHGDPLLTIGDAAIRIVPCTTPLAMRAALHDRIDGERLVLLTELGDVELGDGLLAHVSRCTVRSVNAWDLVRQVFRTAALDPTISDSKYGGGRWIADALTDYAPAEGWPPPAGTILTREHALRCLSSQLLGIDGDQLDSAGLLDWSTDPQRQLGFAELPKQVSDGLTAFLEEVAGPTAVPIMATALAGHGVDAIPIGLLIGTLWPKTSGVQPSAEIAAARARLEPFLGGIRLTDSQAVAFQGAAEAWVDRALDSGGQLEVGRLLSRAEAIAQRVDASSLLSKSDLLPAGFIQRLRAFADAVLLATPAAGQASADLIAAGQRTFAAVETHRAADPARIETARMAVRLLRWLATSDPTPSTLAGAVDRQVNDDSWVDRARLDLFAGDVDPDVAQAYKRLYHAVDARRARHDKQFAHLLAADTAANAEPGKLLRVEDVLENVIQPILGHDRRVLLLILDGMSVAASTELAESLLRSGPWVELSPDGGPRIGILAALPTVTEVSRCSLLSGRIAVGQQREERAAFNQRFPKGLLLHKADLRAGAGSALDGDVLAAVSDIFVPVVVAVINTIDDALDRSDPGVIVWGQENIGAVRDLMAHAHDRVVVIVSDHGHVVDRGPDAVTIPSPSKENRWRPASPSPADGEISMSGLRVAKGNGSIVLPWREEVRYGPRKAGYHGGASPAEVVIPLLILATSESAAPGWTGAPVASPTWWREAIENVTPEPVKAGNGKRRTSKHPEQETTLFDLPKAALPTAPVQPALIAALIASDLYRQRKDSRAPLSDERVAALLEVLLTTGGRATLETLAAHASVPAHRISGIMTAMRKILQIEGYPVLTIDSDGVTYKLDSALLAEQFQLELP